MPEIGKLDTDNPWSRVPVFRSSQQLFPLLAAFAAADSNMAVEEELRMQGNAHFCRREWQKAIEKYGACIDSSVAKGESADKTNLVLAYSNRAEARLQLGEHVGALADCEKLLELDNAHLKSLSRKGRSLHCLKLFQDAVEFYRLVLDPGANATLEKCLKQAEVADKQSREGLYELDDWWSHAPATRKPALEDFIGPVEIRRTRNMGRGVCVTEDVEAGQLLFATAPLFLVPDMDAGDGINLEPLQNAIQKAKGDVGNLCHLQLLVQVDTLLGPHPDDACRDVPSSRFFKPLNALDEKDRLVTSHDLKHPAIKQQYRHQDLIELLFTRNFRWTTPGGDKSKELGIYSLPSLVNHSCIPNMHFQGSIGALKIARASRPIRAGEELMFPYLPVLCPLKERTSYLDGKFVCACERCGLEAYLMRQIPNLGALEDECSKLWLQEKPLLIGLSEQETGHSTNRCLATIKRVEEILSGHPECKNLEEEKKHWVRASFSRLYRLLLDPDQVWEDDVSLASRDHYKDLIHKAVAASSEALSLLSHSSLSGFTMGGRPTFEPHPNTLRMARQLVGIIYGPDMSEGAFTTVFNESSGISFP